MALLEQTLDTINAEAGKYNFCVHYAVKANADQKILQLISSKGLGADCVSGGEIQRCLESGFDSHKIFFAGVGKTDAEINLSLEAEIGCFNVESTAELYVINELAAAAGKKARIALRINPNIDAHTHEYITTGLAENKFGIAHERAIEIAIEASKLSNIELVGLHFHIGSQVLDFEPFALLCQRINTLQSEFEAAGITSLKIINVGGGLGINYDDPNGDPIPDFTNYFATFANNINLRPGQQLHFELGRAVVAQCGSLISRVVYVKEGVNKKFLILDAGMTDLIRPALYDAHHNIENISRNGAAATQAYDVVGPICESSDRFAEAEMLPESKRGDLIALRSAGAYGQIMASQYNCRPLPTSVYF